ncbi:hypothetical protein OAF54_01195 [bacterium]|nr:hypothetical protein [bacterium]
MSVVTGHSGGQYGSRITSETWSCAVTGAPCRLNTATGSKIRTEQKWATRLTHLMYMEPISGVDLMDYSETRVVITKAGESTPKTYLVLQPSTPADATKTHHWKLFLEISKDANY